MVLKLTDSQQCKLAIKPTDKAGNVAPIDGAPDWRSSNSEVVTVTPSADGLSADVVTTGALGTATVSVSADADLGEGTKQISGSIDIEVGAGEAVTVEVTAGTPEEKE